MYVYVYITIHSTSASFNSLECNQNCYISYAHLFAIPKKLWHHNNIRDRPHQHHRQTTSTSQTELACDTSTSQTDHINTTDRACLWHHINTTDGACLFNTIAHPSQHHSGLLPPPSTHDTVLYFSLPQQWILITQVPDAFVKNAVM